MRGMTITQEQVAIAVRTADVIASLTGALCALALWAARRRLLERSQPITNVLTVLAFFGVFFATGVVGTVVTEVLVNHWDGESQLGVYRGLWSRLVPIGTGLLVYFLLIFTFRPRRLSDERP
jgi:hypothetical protein